MPKPAPKPDDPDQSARGNPEDFARKFRKVAAAPREAPKPKKARKTRAKR
jgi:hypothetical protein